jgi:hypothetical protein
MTIKALVAFALMMAMICFLQVGLAAGDKKKPEPAKDIIFSDELLNADLKDTILTESFRKTYTVKLEKHKLYEIVLTSKAFAPHLRLENAERELIDAANGPPAGASIYHRPAKTDNYEVIVSSQNAGAMGKFTLVVKEVPGDDGKPIEVKNDKGKGVFEGKLLKTDPIYKAGKKHKMLLFQMAAGKTYQIDMISKAFDCYLFLESPAGKYITEDDDSGGNLNARIIHKATEAGQYRIVCTYFSPAMGDFRVTIRQTD